MKLFLIGHTGVGKSYIGEILKDQFGFFFYEGDSDIPQSMRHAIATESKITEAMRNEFFSGLFASVQEEAKKHDRIVVAQTFVKERFRKRALELFPDAVFVLVKASPKVRLKRISKRKKMSMSTDYIRKMDRRFQKIEIPYKTIVNNAQGKDSIIDQLKKLGFIRV